MQQSLEKYTGLKIPREKKAQQPSALYQKGCFQVSIPCSIQALWSLCESGDIEVAVTKVSKTPCAFESQSTASHLANTLWVYSFEDHFFFSFTGTIPNVTQTVGPFIPSCIITSGPRKRIKGQWNDRLRLWNKLSSQRQTVATFKISLSAPTVITSHLCSGKVKLPQQDVCVEYCYPALAGNNIKQWVYHVTSHEPGKKIKKYTIDYTSKVMEACDWTRFRYKWKDVLAWIKKCFFGI